MEVNSFYQCLEYASAIKGAAATIDQSPWIASLAGVLVGFVLSLIASIGSRVWRERRQKQAIIAELQVVKTQAERTYKATAAFTFHCLTRGTESCKYDPAVSIGLRLFEQLYPGVVHLFSEGQNERFQYVVGHLDSLNRGVDFIMANLDKHPKSFLGHLAAVMGHSILLATCCEAIITNTSARSDEPLDPVVFARQLGISDEVIEAVVETD
tara:strand:+ start:285 stop:917 length:633 start_codon:yes stop_codon:yes gene_type:complete